MSLLLAITLWFLIKKNVETAAPREPIVELNNRSDAPKKTNAPDIRPDKTKKPDKTETRNAKSNN
jgi:hypothetical protein